MFGGLVLRALPDHSTTLEQGRNLNAACPEFQGILKEVTGQNGIMVPTFSIAQTSNVYGPYGVVNRTDEVQAFAGVQRLTRTTEAIVKARSEGGMRAHEKLAAPAFRVAEAADGFREAGGGEVEKSERGEQFEVMEMGIKCG